MSRRADPADMMWAQACDLLDQAERLHRRFFRLASAVPGESTWEPPVDVFEDDREVVVVVALPGVAADRVEVYADRDALVVRAERPLPFGAGRPVVRQLEIPYGRFERRIALPAARLEAGRPELINGCLILRLRQV